MNSRFGQFKILAELKFWADFKILAFLNLELRILADFKILAFQNLEFKIFGDFKILTCATDINIIKEIKGDVQNQP